MNRRTLMLGTASVGLLAAFGVGATLMRPSVSNEGERFELELSDAQWRARLSENQYLVLREHQTEKPYSSPLNAETRDGAYHCAGCDLPVFAAADKYDSGTGWPSFTRPLENAIGTRPDNTLFAARTEVHCRRCGGHFGHVFDDGPPPTGKRYCMNGLALAFTPAA